jgi:hypothetical protein
LGSHQEKRKHRPVCVCVGGDPSGAMAGESLGPWICFWRLEPQMAFSRRVCQAHVGALDGSGDSGQRNSAQPGTHNPQR